ncbi:MAG TPA: kelch repeat-containing protein [Blastocatellia bacterium]|nr:kelch repeat-containing protein [Blastocatellia bacterium]
MMTYALKTILIALAAVCLLAHADTGCGSAEVAPSVGTVIPGGSMGTARAAHTATLLPDGNVLIAGGMLRSGVFTNGAELYNSAAGTFKATGSMITARAGHTATLLPTGKVLIAGGSNDEWLSSCELYDPATGKFSSLGNLSAQRGGSTATLLPDGKVLFAGGFDGNLLSSAELFDSATAAFRPTGKMSMPRSAHTATLLPDGRVLIAGGGAGGRVLASAEVYDPTTGTFTLTGSMQVPRHKHGAVLLSNGNALILGGSDNRDSRGQYASAEVYHPATGTFTASANMSAGRFKIPNAVATLRNNTVLVAGGGEQLEIYDARTGGFTLAGGRVDAARYFSTATPLPDGKVLITGGYDSRIEASARAWIYKP